ncbi:MAG: lycopene cyclase family protein [Cyanobacteriota bacterium]|nr:lycopene cyclase family protein [Cyanobacteriota bacterium]
MPAAAKLDVLVIGSGPAALAIAAALAERGVEVGGLAPQDPTTPWINTYGIWGQEVDSLGLQHLLKHRWRDTVSYFGPGARDPGDTANRCHTHGLDYGLFDKGKLQQHWLDHASRHGTRWWRDRAVAATHRATHSEVQTGTGTTLSARLIVDATGHQPVFVTSTAQGPVAGQAAYGVVARFDKPPIAPERFVFMDYRSDHLEPAQRREPPTFLYAMHLGDDVYFVEETSLALAPAVPFPVLKRRLQQRLQARGAVIRDVLEEEHCLFPMNPPLPRQDQPVVGFGGAAGMVHPASGFMVGSLLRRAPELAAAISNGLNSPSLGPAQLASLAWQTLWPQQLRLKREFYRFGLQKLMGFEEAQLRHHFEAFFQLPTQQWFGFLTNTQTPGELALAMAQLFAVAPWDVRTGLLLPAKASPRWLTMAENTFSDDNG